MASLLIIAHGSRRAASNDEVSALADAVRDRPGQPYDHVETAFLELATPDIPTALEALAARGACDIVALPYFLAAGTHVTLDIPAALDAFRAAHPHVSVRLTPHLGASAALPTALLDVAG